MSQATLGYGKIGTHAKAKVEFHLLETKLNIAIRDRIVPRFEQCVKAAAEAAADNMPHSFYPSAPGEFPRRVLENLANNIGYDVHGDFPGNLVARFGVLTTHAADGTWLIYALYLESGWESGGKHHLPRPWISLTIDEVWDEWKDILGGKGATVPLEVLNG